MSENLRASRIFIASPGGLAEERGVVRDEMQRFNELSGLASGAVFYAVGWEQTVAGVGRPQALINEDLRACDYMVLLFKDRWGSPTGVADGYSSGTEEEFANAVRLLADGDAPMRNILVMFNTIDSARMADPGPDLSRVLDFRDQLERSRELLYATWDSVTNLRLNVSRALNEWAMDGAEKTPKTISYIPRSTVNGAPPEPNLDINALLGRAKDKARDGLHSQAEQLFARASEGNDPSALAEYAKYMRRRGRLETARGLNGRAIGMYASVDVLDPASASRFIETIANNSIIARKLGDVRGSEELAREAIATAGKFQSDVQVAHSYAFDTLGHALDTKGALEEARYNFEAAAEIRSALGDRTLCAQSLVNLGRNAARRSDVDQARAQFDEAIRILSDSEPSLIEANARAGRSKIRLDSGDLEGAEDDAKRALSLNQELGNSDGLSISLARLASIELRQGNFEAARHTAEMVRDESERSGNLAGRATAAFLLARAESGLDHPIEAETLTTQAVADSVATHNPGFQRAVRSAFPEAES